jgi:hypothetical protein
MIMSPMLRAFCDAVERRNGKAFAELFTEDGVYHDVLSSSVKADDPVRRGPSIYSSCSGTLDARLRGA